MLEIVLTREDANTEFALLAEWLVADRAEVEQGQPVCVVETTKATVEVEAPGAGTIVQLYEEGVEVELGKVVARIAESAEELASLDVGEYAEKPAPPAGERKATRKAVELAERHGIDLSTIEKRGFITEKDVEALIARAAADAAPSERPLLAGISTEGVTLPALFHAVEDDGLVEGPYRPAAVPYRIVARGATSKARVQFDKLDTRIGTSELSASGELQLQPALASRQFSIRAEGNRLSDLGTFGDWSLADKPFSASAVITGDNDTLRVADVKLLIGASDVTGDLVFRNGTPRQLTLELRSEGPLRGIALLDGRPRDPA